MLEHTFLDFGLPTITGGLVQSHPSQELLNQPTEGSRHGGRQCLSVGHLSLTDLWIGMSSPEAHRSTISPCADDIDFRAGNNLSKSISKRRLTNRSGLPATISRRPSPFPSSCRI